MRTDHTLVRNLVLTALLLLALPVAGESSWVGQNGVVRFSFADGDSLVPVLTTGESDHGVTQIHLYAWLTDIDPVAIDKIAFLRVGAFEMKLVIEGAEAFITKEEFYDQAMNIGRAQGEIAVGLANGYKVVDGRVRLGHWEILFQGRPEDVAFRLESEAIASCAKTEGCDESDPFLVYVGTSTSDLSDYMFGAGYQAGWLNPTGAPDLEVHNAKTSWQDVGIAAAR